MKAGFILLLFFSASVLFGQYHDNIWMLGYAGGDLSPEDSTFGISVLDFTDGSLTISNNQIINLGFGITNTNMSDSNGNLLFYTNGVYIENASFEPMENGDALNPGSKRSGFTLDEGIIALPYPGNPDKYLLLYENLDFTIKGISVAVTKLFYSVVDMREGNGLGRVTEKNIELLSDTLHNGKLNVVRHANGRDWWLLVQEWNSDKFYTILIDPNGPRLKFIQLAGTPIINGVGQAAFSPDGTRFAMYNTISREIGQFVDIYDFDRCSGLLSNQTRIRYDEDAHSGGVAFSLNSRYLYISSYLNIYQFDMEADSIEASRIKIAEYDGYLNPLWTTFNQAGLARDGKIYISANNGVFNLHVIHAPNKIGQECKVEQHGILLPTYNAFGLPNHPFYRLGPIDNSLCDTLGIDNIPLADFRFEADTNDFQHIYFTDLSHYEPEDWYWEFGDSHTSRDRNPTHNYDEPGVYEVCLTVSNDNGSDTKCRTLNLGVTSANNPSIDLKINLFPNPFQDLLTISTASSFRGNLQFHLYDSFGRLVQSSDLVLNWKSFETVNLGFLAPGVYFYKLASGQKILQTGKVVKVRRN